MAEMNDLIPLAEYAARIGKNPVVVRQKCLRGTLAGAVKLGRDWFVPADAPYGDSRVKSGQYRNWRKKTEKPDAAEPTEESME